MNEELKDWLVSATSDGNGLIMQARTPAEAAREYCRRVYKDPGKPSWREKALVVRHVSQSKTRLVVTPPSNEWIVRNENR